MSLSDLLILTDSFGPRQLLDSLPRVVYWNQFLDIYQFCEVDVSLYGVHSGRQSFPRNSHILKNIEERRGNMDILENYGSLSNIELLEGKPEHSEDQKMQ